ncbi:hypothetical protein [Streptomyces dubilierae]|uniref:Uncharacterized protein n=1 Tax=Streptomyces dubilierae TaxID=3075533 RepID=A0ABU2PMT0_9ACTN|nr:hypothetical protein [Streptomyces sp. DSM 41921]MDT0393018.1 hypothetical protein [Streptomyces sp. DSM 41921]
MRRPHRGIPAQHALRRSLLARDPRCSTPASASSNPPFLRNNDKDTLYLYKPMVSRAGIHTCTKPSSGPDGNGYGYSYISFH